MAQLKKNIARLVLQGISILGIFLGFGFLCCPFFFISLIRRDNLAILCGGLILLGALFVLGIYLIYTSYLMFRGRAFGAIKSISALLALYFFGLVEPLGKVFTPASVSGKMARLIEDIAGVASLLSIVVVYLICVKLMKRLLEVAYGPKNISGTQHSTDKQ